MNDVRKVWRFAVWLLLLWLAVLGTWGTGQSQQTPKAPEASSSSQDEAASVVSDQPITKAEAKALFRSVDEILQIVSQDTGLPIKHKVKRRLITRDQVERYVAKRLESDKDAQRLEREQLVLKKFGLIPSNYDLHAEFLKLLREQVAAYYDPKTKTVNLLDWVRPELQRPVLAHELTHALQDQSVDLRVWFRAGAKENGTLPDEQEQVVEEAQAAREGVAEGQAMVAMIDYILAPSGLNILKAPDVVNSMRASMTDDKNLPVLAAAPAYLRESLLMPYAFGFDFEHAVLAAKGTDAAFGGVLKSPPQDTFEVMDSGAYLDNQSVAPLKIPDLDKLIAPDYERYDFGGMGAFDVYLLAKQYVPDKDPKEYYPHWRGGYYLAAHAKTAPKDRIALIYLSRWDSPETARAFATMYGDYAPKRYTIPPLRAPGNSPGGDESDNLSLSWDFGEQGKVVIQTRGDQLLILEGFDETVTQRAQKALF